MLHQRDNTTRRLKLSCFAFTLLVACFNQVEQHCAHPIIINHLKILTSPTVLANAAPPNLGKLEPAGVFMKPPHAQLVVFTMGRTSFLDPVLRNGPLPVVLVSRILGTAARMAQLFDSLLVGSLLILYFPIGGVFSNPLQRPDPVSHSSDASFPWTVTMHDPCCCIVADA
ncbi:hypothetical protein P154DRAFT_261830 [Amniculicola lignicola CBS 123094]|uniref:Uncharacterized protein n=1 Tax=Amniculicola lignicola CBS 123094 TaxID=1392246 RepID=A0A6A5WGH5_9PLEO|nr:hypothetical protein P154DRAFT_261830 [Amniculicola lignicola CBS 123094]